MRRNFVGSAEIVAAGLMSRQSQILRAVPKATTELGKVRITDVKTGVTNIDYPTTLVKVVTDSGLLGVELNEDACRSHLQEGSTFFE